MQRLYNVLQLRHQFLRLCGSLLALLAQFFHSFSQIVQLLFATLQLFGYFVPVTDCSVLSELISLVRGCGEDGFVLLNVLNDLIIFVNLLLYSATIRFHFSYSCSNLSNETNNLQYECRELFS
uniref:Uncharacterized protein n=1 Tax=Cacopsylla melanoneura TaxID=428564 RepID=A0A8D8U1D8_9HEMI